MYQLIKLEEQVTDNLTVTNHEDPPEVIFQGVQVILGTILTTDLITEEVDINQSCLTFPLVVD